MKFDLSSQQNKAIKLITLKEGRTLAYAEYGDSRGKTCFFFHGWPCSRIHSEFTDQIAKKLKIRIISPDRPGYGLSDFKKNRTLLDYPNDIEELANQLKLSKFAVVGVSGGGPYAAAVAYKIPKRINKAGIVVGIGPTYIKGILEGVGFVNKLGWENYARYPLLIPISALLGLIQARYLPFLTPFGFGAKQDKQFMTKDFLRFTRRLRTEAFRQGIKGPALDLKLYTHNWRFKLKDIKAKVYLWYGEDDKNVSLTMGKYYASQIPNSKLTIYPNEGHLVMNRHAKEILRTLTSD